MLGVIDERLSAFLQVPELQQVKESYSNSTLNNEFKQTDKNPTVWLHFYCQIRYQKDYILCLEKLN